MIKKSNFGLIARMVCMTLVVVMVVVLCMMIVSVTMIRRTCYDLAVEELRATAYHLESQLSHEYDGDWTLSEEGRLLKGGVDVYDEFTSEMESLQDETNIIYALFYENTLMLTSLKGEKNIGVQREGSLYESVLKTGVDYYETDYVMNGSHYFVYYAPIMNSDNTVIGYICTTRSAADVAKNIRDVVIVILLVAVVLLTIIFILGVFLHKSLTKKMRHVADSINKISTGSIETEIDKAVASRKDEIGEIGSSALGLSLKLKEIMGKVKTLTTSLNESGVQLTTNSKSAMEATQQVSSAVDGISKGAVSQADSIQTAVGSTSIIGDNIRLISDNVNHLNEASLKMQDSCSDTKNTLSILVNQSKKVSSSVNTISTTIDSTNKSAKEISEFTEAINSIATQTNLLSLNASIEAARAGEAGKGFAVVATEISNLATQSKESADKINEIVNELLSDVAESVEVLQVLNEDYAEQEKQLDATREAMDSMEEGIKDVSQNAEGIKQQVVDLVEARDNLNDVISDLSAISEENAASAEETNASMEELAATFVYINDSAEDLRKLAVDLDEAVSYFR